MQTLKNIQSLQQHQQIPHNLQQSPQNLQNNYQQQNQQQTLQDQQIENHHYSSAPQQLQQINQSYVNVNLSQDPGIDFKRLKKMENFYPKKRMFANNLHHKTSMQIVGNDHQDSQLSLKYTGSNLQIYIIHQYLKVQGNFFIFYLIFRSGKKYKINQIQYTIPQKILNHTYQGNQSIEQQFPNHVNQIPLNSQHLNYTQDYSLNQGYSHQNPQNPSQNSHYSLISQEDQYPQLIQQNGHQNYTQTLSRLRNQNIREDPNVSLEQLRHQSRQIQISQQQQMAFKRFSQNNVELHSNLSHENSLNSIHDKSRNFHTSSPQIYTKNQSMPIEGVNNDSQPIQVQNGYINGNEYVQEIDRNQQTQSQLKSDILGINPNLLNYNRPQFYNQSITPQNKKRISNKILLSYKILASNFYKIPLGKIVTQIEMKNPETRKQLKDILEQQIKEKEIQKFDELQRKFEKSIGFKFESPSELEITHHAQNPQFIHKDYG